MDINFITIKSYKNSLVADVLWLFINSYLLKFVHLTSNFLNNNNIYSQILIVFIMLNGDLWLSLVH